MNSSFGDNVGVEAIAKVNRVDVVARRQQVSIELGKAV